MAIVIRTPRGEITTPQITQGRNQLATAISTRRDTSKPLKAIEQAIRYKQEYDARIDRENLINIETDYEANTSLQTFQKLEEIKQRLKDEDLTEETLNDLADDYGKELDKSHISKFKNNKAALERTNSIKNSQKLLFMREVFKYKDSRILGKIVEREETGKKLIFQDLETRVKNFRNDSAALAILESSKERYLTKYGNALVQSSGKQDKTLQGLQEVENKFYEEIIIHRNPQTREIDFEQTEKFLKKNRIGGKPIPQNQRDVISNYLTKEKQDKYQNFTIDEQNTNIAIIDILDKALEDGTLSHKMLNEQMAKLKGTGKTKIIDSYRENLDPNRIIQQSDPLQMAAIDKMIANKDILNLNDPFLTPIEEQLNETLPEQNQYKPLSVNDRNGASLINENGEINIQAMKSSDYSNFVEPLSQFKTGFQKELVSQTDKFIKIITEEIQLTDVMSERLNAEHIRRVSADIRKWINNNAKGKNGFARIPLEELFDSDPDNINVYTYFDKNKFKNEFVLGEEEQMRLEIEFEQKQKKQIERSIDLETGVEIKLPDIGTGYSQEEIDKMLSD